MWVMPHIFFARLLSQAHHISSHDQQYVSDHAMALFLCQAVLSIMSHPMTNSMSATLHYFLVSSSMSHPVTNRKWVTLCYLLPGSLISHVSSYDQQKVSHTALSLRLINHVWSHDQQYVSVTTRYGLLHYDTSDRPVYFPFNLLNLATPL